MRRGRTRAAQFQHLMPPGIQREGVSCFLIAGVQLLRAVHPIYHTLRGFQYLDRDRMTNKMRMTDQLSRLYKSEGRGTLNLIPFVRSFQPLSRGLHEGEIQVSASGRVTMQNDASESLTHLLTCLETPAGAPLIVNHTFGGETVQVNRNGVKVMDDAYAKEFQCYLPDDDVNGFTTITEGILTGLHLGEVNRDRRLESLNEYILVVVGRYGWDEGKGKAFKNLRSVILEMELDVTPFCTDTLATALRTQGSHKYELRGVVCHDGSTTKSGHYRTFVRLEHGENVWCECDDANVTFKEQEEIAELGKSCYLLLYRRSTSQPVDDIQARSSSSNNTQQDANPPPPDNKDIPSDEISDNMSVDNMGDNEELEEEKQESEEDTPSRKRRKILQKPKSPPPVSDDDPDSSEDEWEPLPEDESDSDSEDENLFAVDDEEVEDLEFKDICEEDYDENEEETQASENLPWQGIPKSAPPSKICHYPDCKKPWPVNKKRAHHWEHHTGPYTCPVCGEILKRRSILNNHVVSEHGSLIGLDRTDIPRKRRNPAANLKEFRNQIGIDVTNVPVEKITRINCGKFILYVQKGTGKLILAVHEVRRMPGQKAEDLPDDKSRHYEYKRKKFKYVPPRVVNHQKFDNAHAVPRADFVSAKYQRRTMNMLNRIPFVPEMNRRVSKQIEELGRKLAPKYVQEIQFTIPVYSEDNRLVPGGLILPVPTGLFRVLYLKDKKGHVTIQPYLIPNDRKVSFKHYLSFASSYKEIELLTGVRLFTDLENVPAPTWNSYVPREVDLSDENIFEQQQNLKKQLKAVRKDWNYIWKKNKPILSPKPRGKLFRCSFAGCGKEFPSEMELKVHRREHKEIRCPCCSEVFQSREDMRKHLEKDEGLHWDHCYTKECNKALYPNIILHQQQSHSGDTQCGLCGLSFTGSISCTYHIYSRHPEFLSLITPLPESSPNYKEIKPARIVERSGRGFSIQKPSFTISRGTDSTLYVDERLREKVASKQCQRPCTFYFEKGIENQTSGEAIHYSGGQVGHLAAVGNYAEKSKDESATMSLINTTFMDGHLNVSSWKSLENFVRACTGCGRTVQVVSGPIYEESVKTVTSLCGEQIKVAAGFFKIILVHVPGVDNFPFVFITPNLQERNKTFLDYRSTLKQINDLTGLDFDIEGEWENPWTWGISNQGFPCKIKQCRDVFLLHDDLLAHIADKHPYVCGRCRESFANAGDKDKHEEECTYNYTCNECSKWFKNRFALDVHIRIHSGEKPYKCSECNRKFRQISCRTAHEDLHFKNNDYVCDVCGAYFFTRARMTGHKLKRHPDNEGNFRYQCDICGIPFGTSTELKQHAKLHDTDRKIACAIKDCTYKFNQECDMIQHVRFFHAHLDEARKLMKEMYPNNLCSVCGMGYATQFYLALHMETHKDERLFQCKLCPSNFKRKDALSTHMRNVHPKEDRLPCPYPGCMKTYEKETLLLKHQLKKHPDLGEEAIDQIKQRQDEIKKEKKKTRNEYSRIRQIKVRQNIKETMTEEEQKARREISYQYNLKHKANRTEEKLKAEYEKHNKSRRDKRENETEEEKVKRRRERKEKETAKRKNETEEEKEKRLRKLREKETAKRKNETVEEKENRLKRRREYERRRRRAAKKKKGMK